MLLQWAQKAKYYEKEARKVGGSMAEAQSPGHLEDKHHGWECPREGY